MKLSHSGPIAALMATLAVSGLAATKAATGYGKIPLAFEENRGQGDRAAQYFARGQGYSVALYSDGAAFHLRGKKGASQPSISFVGASATARAAHKDPLERKVNYFLGSNPKNWKTDIPTFRRVQYAGIYPGIDVVYYGNEGKLEYDFVVAPKADPDQIRIRLSGGRATLDNNGDLVIGEFRQQKPVAYQVLADGTRQPVECRYQLRGNEARLVAANYDHSRALVIDPTFVYGSYLGGSGNEAVLSVKVDSAGATYMAGFTTSGNFPSRAGQQSTYGGATTPAQYVQLGDAFVAKLNAAGTDLVYATYLGGSGDDVAVSLAIDGAGNAYVGGSTRSRNFPATSSAFQKTFGGLGDNGFYDPGDGFVAKLNPTGNQLVYATYLGGAGNDTVWSIAVDASGNAVAGGNTTSTNFPTTDSAYSKNFRGAQKLTTLEAGDGFVTRLNATGSDLLYSTFLGGRGHDMVKALTLDAQGNIYVCGFTFSGDFPTTAGAFQRTFRGGESDIDYNSAISDAFVAKLSTGGGLVYSTFLGGTYRDSAWGIAVDNAGAAYVTGRTASSNFPTTTDAIQTDYKGKEQFGSTGELFIGDAFITKLNPAGTALVYSTYLGGPGDETGTDIVVDGAGNAYVTGLTTSPTFPVSRDALQPAYAGLGGQGIIGRPGDAMNTGDAFLVKLGPSGSMVYSSFYGGSGDDAAMALALDSTGNVYIAGNTLSNNLKTSTDAFGKTFGGFSQIFPRGDGFIAKISFATGGTPARLNVVSGFNGVGNAGAALATPFIVEVTDSTGAVLPGVQVTFGATNATVSPATASTDARGRASTTVTLGSTAGTGTVTATVAGLPVATATLTINAAGPPAPVVKALVNGASFNNDVSPGSWITLYVDNSVTSSASASAVPLPRTLGNVRILVNGSPIPLLLVSPGQMNAQLPYEVAAGTAQAVVEINGRPSAAYAFTVKQAAPGIFVFGSNRAVVQNVGADGSVSVNTTDNPAPAGSYIIVYFTGQGPLDNAVPSGDLASGSPLSRPTVPVSISIGSSAVTPDFVGMTPGQIGLAQANVKLPADLPPGEYAVKIAIQGVPSNGPVITVTRPLP